MILINMFYLMRSGAALCFGTKLCVDINIVIVLIILYSDPANTTGKGNASDVDVIHQRHFFLFVAQSLYNFNGLHDIFFCSAFCKAEKHAHIFTVF